MLFERATSLRTLEDAWVKVRTNAGGAGGDGLTVEAFDRTANDSLLRLQRALRSGAYRPGPLRRVTIPKKDGERRWLAIPCVVDRVAQTAAAIVLMPVLEGEMEDDSFAYRPERSVQMAVARIAKHRREGFTWVVDGDIERYFDNVPHDRLMNRLGRSLGEARLLDLIGLWLEGFSDTGRGLPQGSPISPLLANLYLDDVDEAIAGRGIRLVRFADDFVLLCKDRVRAGRARERMERLLADYGLRLHPDKTRIVPFQQGFRFLGHLFVRSLILKEVDEGEDDPMETAVAALQRPSLPPGTAPAVADDPKPASDEGLSPGLRVLYVTEPGRLLDVRNQAFAVREGTARSADDGGTSVSGEELIAIPWARVDRIELYPNTRASDAALLHAAATGRQVAYVNGRGETLATVEKPALDRGGLHLAQARHGLDAGLRFDLAGRLVDGRLRNQRALLRRLNRRRKNPEVVAALTRLNRVIRKVPHARDLSRLLGIEGEGTALYWPALGRTLEHGWSFRHRRRRPPRDPVNLLLSFLSSLLYRDLGVMIARRGLHPGFGALHASRDGHPACASDLIEAFRAPLVEGLTVYLLNNRALAPEMFTQGEQGTCRIAREGVRAVIRGYEAWLDRPVKSPRTGTRLAWRELVEDDVGAYARHVTGEEPFSPYVMDY